MRRLFSRLGISLVSLVPLVNGALLYPAYRFGCHMYGHGLIMSSRMSGLAAKLLAFVIAAAVWLIVAAVLDGLIFFLAMKVSSSE